jgi:hypothetical protein
VKRSFLPAVALAGALALSAGVASADVLQITGFYLGSAIVAPLAVASLSESGSFYAGAFSATLNGQALNQPIYCLDLGHSFSFGQTWNVTTIVVPPDPPNPPPFNTGEASWLYNKYASSASTTARSGGVQLALWEISHDQNWRTDWTNAVGNNTNYAWWANGNFTYGNIGSSEGQYADQIMDDVFQNYDVNQAGHVTYYQPNPLTGAGQGQIGSVPEPGTIMMLVMGLSGLGIGAWRKRR